MPNAIGDSLVVSDGTNTLIITRAEVVARETELRRAGVVSCDSTGSDDDCEYFSTNARLITLPLASGVSQSIGVEVPAGTSHGDGSYIPGTMTHLELVALIVRDYDPAIDFFTRILGFDLIEDRAATTNDGRPKRWVVVRPPGAVTGLLLARADGETQEQAVGVQFAGRVGFFLRVDDFDVTHARLVAAGVRFVIAPRTEAYGKVAVFLDLEGNRWDLLGPPTA
jgi:catechol 2,3-dioxygenase-like lactoylglutathione lyase family enzyme